MIISNTERKKQISLAVTTYGTQSYYTHACLEAIRKWKSCRHELIVAVHDASPLMETYLKKCHKEGLIDILIFTPSKFGHTKGVNECLKKASGEILFNIANDMVIGPVIVDDCANKLLNNKNIGIVGWHWFNEGTFWKDGKISKYDIRDPKNPALPQREIENIKNAKWYTGKVFDSVGFIELHLCNTAFFGIRKELWEKVGGFGKEYHHFWADAFLSYAALDQELDVQSFDNKFKNRYYFHSFQHDNADVKDHRRDYDYVPIPEWLEHYTGDGSMLAGGLSKEERSFLYTFAGSLNKNKTILHIGLWRGAGMALFLDAMKQKKTNFIGIDYFDTPNISTMSGQPPVTEMEVTKYLESLISDNNLILTKTNTITIKELPPSDVIFIDGIHLQKWIENDIILALRAIKKNGTIICHDYGHPMWPDVKPIVDKYCKNIRTFQTLAVIQP